MQRALASASDELEGDVFALVDAAQDEGIAARLAGGEVEAECLYEGAAPALAAAGPWLVAVDPEAPLAAWLLEEGWGQGWATWVVADATLADLRGHFRKLLMVQREGGGQVYFRFYDPRVLRVYLPTATPEELEVVFGPVKGYLTEDRNPARVVRFTRDEAGALARAASALEATPAAEDAPVGAGGEA